MKIRKLIALVAVATMVASTMVGCGGATKSKDKDTNVSTESTTEVENTTETEVETEVESTETVENETEAETEVEDATEVEDTTEVDTEAEVVGDTVALKLYNAFEASVGSATDLEELANTLATNEMFSEVSMTTMVIEPGFLNGFGAEINGFNNGVMVAPMVGTIPFVCYVFETDAPEALVGELEANHDLRWNICTEADEMLVKQYENFVFFVMSPYNFEG